MKRHLWHPSKRRLSTWLEHGDESIESHLSDCEHCATRLEDLSQPSPSIRDALSTMLAPPDDLQPRLRAGISRRMQAREDMRLLVELMGIPWQTAQAISPNGNPDNPPNTAAT